MEGCTHGFYFKKIIFILIIILFFIQHAFSLKKSIKCPLTFKTSQTWHEFHLKPYEKNFKFEKWVLRSLITFKSKDAVKLQALTLQWKGKNLNHLSASLYIKKHANESLFPIEKNLVCDGTWNRTQQQIIFKLNEKIVAVNDYYLVLSFPRTLEPFVKHGTFSVTKTDLLAWTP